MRGPLVMFILAMLCIVANAQDISNPGVLGPASATSGHIATYSGTTGKILQDGGAPNTGTVTSVTCGTGLSGGTITTTGTCALVNQNAPYWRQYVASSTPALTSSYANVVFNNSLFDTASSCSLSTGICTPATAGLYWVTCQIRVTAATGPVANNLLAAVAIAKNGTLIAENWTTAQVATISAPDTSLNVSTSVQMNGSTDTLSCQAASQSTTPIIAAGVTQGRTYFTAFRTGAQ